MPFVGADQADELAVAVEHGPDAGALADRRLAAAARHGHREQSAAQHGLLDLADHLQMVGRPRQVKREREVRFAEEPKVGRRPLLAFGIHHLGQLADVAAGNCQRDVARPGPLLHPLVGIAVGLRLRRVADLDEPGHVAQQVDVAVRRRSAARPACDGDGVAVR